MAAYGVVANLALVGIAVFTGLCTGIQSRWSAAARSGDGEQLRRLFRWGICTRARDCSRCACRFSSARKPLTAVFNSEHDPELTAYGERPADLPRLFVRGREHGHGAFSARRIRPIAGFAISLLRGVIAVPPILFPLAWVLGVDGVWLTFPMVGAGHGGRRTRLGAEVHHWN